MSVSGASYKSYPAIPTGLITRQPNSKFKTSRDGISVLTETYVGNFADLIGSSLRVAGSGHAEFPSMLAYSSEVTQGRAGIGYLQLEYRGNVGGLPEPTYTLDRATHSEPISTHPDWDDTIAGSPSDPQNGAIFVDPETGKVSTDDDTGIFKGWTAGSIFEGVEDYLVAGATWTSSYASYDQPNFSEVGKISTPDGPAPAAPDDSFWIYTGGSSTYQGSVYRVQETWLLTGGMDTDATSIIYGS